MHLHQYFHSTDGETEVQRGSGFAKDQRKRFGGAGGGIKNARPKLLALDRFSVHLSPCAIEAFTKFI